LNRHSRRAEQAEDRKAIKRRGELIALAHQVIGELSDQDETVIGATLILPSGEVAYIDAAMLRRGGCA
jgi:hypothetical protein